MKASDIDAQMEERRNKWKPKSGSGKTRFNRIKKAGESWTELRDKERK